MAPMEFQIMVDSLVKEQYIKSIITGLLNRKLDGEELDQHPKIRPLNDFLEEKINYFNAYVKQTPKPALPETQLLNKLFKEVLSEVWE